MVYIPKIPPGFDNEELRRAMDYVREELQAISSSLVETTSLELRTTNQAPLKPRNGMIAAADGTNWNPGAGAGTYIYQSGAWVKLGNASHTHVLADITNAGSLAALNELPLADMADLATQRVIGRNTGSTGIPEAVTLSQLLDWVGSAARGDLLARGASSWARLAIGSSGKHLISDGTDPAWTTPTSPCDVLLAHQSVGTGTTYTISSSVITKAYRRLELILDGLSHNNGSTARFRLELSGDNGSNWTSTVSISDFHSASEVVDGRVTIDNAHTTSAQIICAQTGLSNNWGSIHNEVDTKTLSAGSYVNAIRLSPAAGNFDATGSSNINLIGFV